MDTGTYASNTYTLTYNGTGGAGQVMVDISDLPNGGDGGVYQVEITEGGQTVAKKLVLIKKIL